MNYTVADVIASMGGDASSRRSGNISAMLRFGIAPGAKAIMRREKAAAEEARSHSRHDTYTEESQPANAHAKAVWQPVDTWR